MTPDSADSIGRLLSLHVAPEHIRADRIVENAEGDHGRRVRILGPSIGRKKNPCCPFPRSDGRFCVDEFESVVPGSGQIHTEDEKAAVALGIDNGVKVERKLLNRVTDRTGLFSKKRTVSFDIAITVQNLKKAARSINIRESIRVSQDEHIKVTLTRPTAEEAVHDANGIITWQMTLAPGARGELRLQYTIESPSDVNVGGG